MAVSDPGGITCIIVDYPASESITDGYPVCIKYTDNRGVVCLANNTDLTQYGINRIFGIAINSASINEIVSVMILGEVVIRNPDTVCFTDNDVFIGNKVLTQTAPTTGYSLIIGYPIAPTILFVKPSVPVLL